MGHERIKTVLEIAFSAFTGGNHAADYSVKQKSFFNSLRKDKMAKKKKVENRGGAREGAGRKPLPDGTVKVPRAIKIKPELDAYLRKQPNATAAIEAAIERSKAFRDWKKTFKKF